MSAKFGHLRKLEVTGEQTSEYVIYDLEGHPCLVVKHAGESNKPYFNAVMRQSTERVRRVRAGATEGMLDENRELDRELYPGHVVVGWTKEPLDSQGNRVPYSPQDCAAFIDALPTHIFDALRNYCAEPRNFLPAQTPSEKEVKNLGEDSARP